MEFTILLQHGINNLHRAVIDAYETLVGLMNSAEVQHMKHIMILNLIMLTISPTTAECERGFSSVNNIKTTARTSMKQEALSSLVRIKADGLDLMEYNHTESIINWLNSGKGTRHIKGHICTGPRLLHLSLMQMTEKSDGWKGIV